MLKNSNNPTIYLKDFQPPSFAILSCTLAFELNAEKTRVTTNYEIERIDKVEKLILDGESLKLLGLKLNNCTVSAKEYKLDDKSLTLFDIPKVFTLEIITEISPATNTSLNGLYKSGDMLCTQCEAQGFRRITYSLDRPDVLTLYTVKISADKSQYPVLLSNGNLIEQGEQGSTHFAVWHDPFPKPTYLFALVVGKLSYHSDSFTTHSGKKVDLHILTRPEDVGKTEHAMASLIRSMAWDESAYDREYDLDIFHLVAVSDFNMGAMENKSLNIFNTKYVLARQHIATDQDYQAIEGVIGHEYFHNWSGNRITCRDWFQLSLKEGFTVLRDQQFSADMGSGGVQRINDVNLLRNIQFKEDAGPMAHPVRPESYEEINNFYTVTVYEKGAEIVRMLHTLLGNEGFKRATNFYFEQFDGQAVTTDDFIDAMEQSSGLDLEQFRRWYFQAGTPVVKLKSNYDAATQTLHLNFSQSTPATPGQDAKKTFFIPIKIALFDVQGNRMSFQHKHQTSNETVLHLLENQQTFEIKSVPSQPMLSTLRGFSAPVKLEYTLDETSLIFLARHDDDPFNRWEAMQRLSLIQIDRVMAGTALSEDYFTLYSSLLQDQQTDPSLLAQLLIFPSESIIGQRMDTIDPDLAHHGRESIITQIAKVCEISLCSRYTDCNKDNTGKWTQAQVGQRALRDACLSILIRLETKAIYALANEQYEHGKCMTDTMGALSCLAHSNYDEKQRVLANFHTKWHDEDLLVNKWFSLQSHETGNEALVNIKKLTQHPDFDINNPNKVYALIGGFLHGNGVTFHALDGSAYDFARHWILKLDAFNPQVAARMVSCFNHWRRYNKKRQALMKAQMQSIASHQGLSDNVSEIINKALG